MVIKPVIFLTSRTERMSSKEFFIYSPDFINPDCHNILMTIVIQRVTPELDISLIIPCENRQVSVF